MPSPTNPQPTETAPDTAPDTTQEDQAHYRRILHELVDLGMDVARHLHRQITAPVAAHPSPAEAAVNQATGDLTLALDRTARMVRRSILLARHLNEAPAAQAQEASRARHQVAARKRIIREVEDTIQRQPGAEHAETAHQELLERLEAPDLDDEIEDRPIGDIIKDLCRDLGLADVPGAPQWTRRSAADIEQLCARAAAPRRQTIRPNPSTPAPRATTAPPSNQHPWPPEPRRRSV